MASNRYLPYLLMIVGLIQCCCLTCLAQDCDSEEVATTSYQFLRSPGTRYYDNNLHCVTHITSNDPHRVIELEFDTFDLEDSDDCEKDALVVYDGVDGGQRLIQHSCGSLWAWPHYPDVVRTSGPEATLLFITDSESDRGYYGYRLKYRTVEAQPWMFFFAAPDEGRIHAIRRDSAINFGIYPEGLQFPQAVDFDPMEENLYYSDYGAKNIGRYNLRFPKTEILHTKQIEDPFGLRLDIVNRLLYWTDADLQTISVSNLDGTKRVTIITGSLDIPGAIVTEPNQGYIYFTDWGFPAKIEKAEGDGTGRVVLVDGMTSSPKGLAIDLSRQPHALYWVDALSDALEMCDVDGQNRKFLRYFHERDFFSIALDSGGIFMTEEQFGWIELVDRERINTTGIRVHVGNIREPRGITLRPRYDMGDTRPYTCPRADCNGLCLPKPNTNYQCKLVIPQLYIPCPNDIQIILPVNTTTWTEPAAYSPLPGLSIVTSRTHTPGQVFPEGINPVSYTFEDDLGNKASCNFTVTLSDRFSLVCPEDINLKTMTGHNQTTATWTPPVDHQGRPVTNSTHNPGDSFEVGVTTITYSTSEEGFPESCSFTVTVVQADQTGPRFLNCPSDIVTFIPVWKTSTFVTWARIKLADSDSKIILRPGDPVFIRPVEDLALHEYYIGDERVSYAASDPDGNIAWCNFTVSVIVDRDPPTIDQCPDDITVEVKPKETKAVVYWQEPVVTDNSGDVNVDKSIAPGSDLSLGQHIIAYQAVDPSGNVEICTFLVSVQQPGSGDVPNNADRIVNEGPLNNDQLLYVIVFGAVIMLLLLIIVLLLIIIAYRCRRKTPRGRLLSDTPSEGNINSLPPDYHYAVGGSRTDERGSAVTISGNNVQYRAENNPVVNISDEHQYDFAAIALPPPKYEEKKVALPGYLKDEKKSVPPGFNSWDE